MQSYLEGIWGLTWSLAVEEHFYLLLPLLLVVIPPANYRWVVPATGILLLFGCTALRYLGVRQSRHRTLGPEPGAPHSCTAGSTIRRRGDRVLVSHATGTLTKVRLKRLHPLLLTVMAAGLVIVLFAPKQIVLSVGLAVLSIGFGGVVLTAACEEPRDSGRFGRAMAEVGRSSYALYLWHIPMFVIFSRLTGLAPNSSVLVFAAYVAVLILWADRSDATLRGSDPCLS